jgi:hypothetical protein
MTNTNPLTTNMAPLTMSLKRDLPRKKKKNQSQEIKNQNLK